MPLEVSVLELLSRLLVSHGIREVEKESTGVLAAGCEGWGYLGDRHWRRLLRSRRDTLGGRRLSAQPGGVASCRRGGGCCEEGKGTNEVCSGPSMACRSSTVGYGLGH